MNKSGMLLCPVVAVLSYPAVHSESNGLLLVHANGLPWLTRDQFVTKVKRALQAAQIDSTLYSKHSFRIGASVNSSSSSRRGAGLFYQDGGKLTGGKVKHTTSTSEPHGSPLLLCHSSSPSEPQQSAAGNWLLTSTHSHDIY